MRNYLDKSDKQSFYFGDTLSSLRIMYAKGAISEANLARTKTLILLGYTKLASKDNKMNPSLIKNVQPGILPQRQTHDESYD